MAISALSNRFSRSAAISIDIRHPLLMASLFLLLLSAGLRLMVYERYLPFQDYTDESAYQVTALHRRGVEENSFVEWRYAGLPPAYVWFTMFAQDRVDQGRAWSLLEDYLHVQRLVAVFVGVLTTLVVISIGWQIGGIIAAWFAGLLWAITPLIVDFNSLAIPDPFVYLSIALAISMLIRAWHTSSPQWLSGALLVGITAIYLKYNPVYILIPWGIVTLVLLRRDPRKMIPWVALQLGFGLVAAWYLMVTYAALDLPAREVDTFRSEGIEMALNPWRNFNNWWSATRPIGEGLFVATILAGAIAYFYSRKRGWRRVELHWYGIFALYTLGGLVMLSSFTNVWEGHITSKIRHVLPVSIALIALWSGAVAQIGWTLGQLRQNLASRAWLPALGIVGLTLAIALPSLALNYEKIQQYQNQDTRQVLWEWTDNNIIPEGRILTRDGDALNRTWNRWWGGYDGVTSFDWWFEASIPENSPTEYVERGIYYFAVTDQDLRTGYHRENPEVQGFVEQLLRVKTIDATAPGRIGDTIHFYRMLAPKVNANISFDGRIILAGYDLDAAELTSGDSLRLRPYWRLADNPRSNYSMFIHLYPIDSLELLAQYDGAPSTAQRPTLTWDDLDELYIGPVVSVQIPGDLDPGDYRLAIGLYDYMTGERLSIDDGETFHSIPVNVS